MIFSSLFDGLEDFTRDFISARAGDLMAALAPGATILAAILVAIYFLNAALGKGGDVHSLVGAVLRIAIPIGIGLSMNHYNILFVGWLTDAPAQILGIVSNGGDINSVGGLLDEILQTCVDAAEPYMEELSPLGGYSMGLMGFLMLIVSVLMTAWSGLLILGAKLLLGVLLALGPLAILPVMFRSTTKFFEGWLHASLNCALLIVVTGTLLVALRGVVLGTISDYEAAGELSLGTAVAFLVTVSVIGLVNWQAWHITQALAGGLQISTMGAIGRMIGRAEGARDFALRHGTPAGMLRDIRRMQLQGYAAQQLGGMARSGAGHAARVLGLAPARPSPAANTNAAPRTTGTYHLPRAANSP